MARAALADACIISRLAQRVELEISPVLAAHQFAFNHDPRGRPEDIIATGSAALLVDIGASGCDLTILRSDLPNNTLVVCGHAHVAEMSTISIDTALVEVGIPEETLDGAPNMLVSGLRQSLAVRPAV